jgi:uncharacterized membrane-anchored protein YitT (DUF2179 family)
MAVFAGGILKSSESVMGVAQVAMRSTSLRALVKDLLNVAWNLGLIAVGCVICVVAINGIIIPNDLLSAGIMGLILLVHYSIPDLPVSLLFLLFNVPIFALGWKVVGRRFLLYSIAGVFIFAIAANWIHVTLTIENKILSALLAGIITGVGAAIILRSRGSAGGLDILTVVLTKRFSIRLGTTVLAFNSVVLTVFALLFSVEEALYTLIYVVVTSYVLNIVTTGLTQRKAVMIVSQAWKEISQSVLNEMNRGLTIIQGCGGYTGQEEKLLYTVITMRDLPHLKRIIGKVDPEAFVVVHDTLKVMGKRIGNQPHW